MTIWRLGLHLDLDNHCPKSAARLSHEHVLRVKAIADGGGKWGIGQYRRPRDIPTTTTTS